MLLASQQDTGILNYLTFYSLVTYLIIKYAYQARMGEMRNAYKIWSEIRKGRNHSEDLSIDRKIILEWILG